MLQHRGSNRCQFRKGRIGVSSRSNWCQFRMPRKRIVESLEIAGCFLETMRERPPNRLSLSVLDTRIGREAEGRTDGSGCCKMWQPRRRQTVSEKPATNTVKMILKRDLPRLEQLWRDIESEEQPGGGGGVERAVQGLRWSLETFDFLSSDSFRIFASESEAERRFVGYATAVRIPKADDRVGFLHIDELYLLSDFRRQGHAPESWSWRCHMPEIWGWRAFASLSIRGIRRLDASTRGSGSSRGTWSCANSGYP